MEVCRVCSRSFKSLNSLGKHIAAAHPEITRQAYYDEYISLVSPVCICENLKTFRDLGVGYQHYCSKSCASFYRSAKPWLGKTQTDEHIKKRVDNTDIAQREAKRRSTMMSRYGTINPAQAPGAREKAQKTSQENWGTDHPMKSQAVFDSRRRHNQHLWKDILVDGKVFRVQGYEDLFLKDLDKFNLKSTDLEEPPTIEYEDAGIVRTYFPDFFVPNQNLIIEIKSSWTLTKHQENLKKKISAVQRAGFNMWVVEYPNRKRKHRLHEYLLSRQ